MAHGAALDTFRRHVPLWLEHRAAAGLVVCPANDPIPQEASPWPVHPVGLSEHNGFEALKRLRWLVETLATKDASHHVIFEYDSICLVPMIARRRGFFGHCRLSMDPRFLAPRYANQPFIIDRESLRFMRAQISAWPELFEQGECDRYFAALAFLAGVPLFPHSPPSYCRATLTKQHIELMGRAIHEGAVYLHGIKDAEILEAAVSFYKTKPPKEG